MLTTNGLITVENISKVTTGNGYVVKNYRESIGASIAESEAYPWTFITSTTGIFTMSDCGICKSYAGSVTTTNTTKAQTD